MYVNDVMSTALKTCHPNATLDEIARLMWDGDCGAIPIVNDIGRPLGVVTDRDIAMAAMLNHKPLWELTATHLIDGQDLCCCEEGDTLESCLNKMEEREVRRILVCDRTGKLCGIVSIGDAVAFARSDSRRKAGTVSPEPVLDMLKKVSAHHDEPASNSSHLH